jgi:hypothetical protein
VEAVSTRGLGGTELRRCGGDRAGHEGIYQATQPSSKTLGVGSSAETASASSAIFCLPPLRNGALWYSGVPCLIGLGRYARTDRHERRAPTLPRCTGGQLEGDAPAPRSGNSGSRGLRRAPRELRAARDYLRWTEFRALRGTTCVDRSPLRSYHASSTVGAVLGRRTLPGDT